MHDCPVHKIDFIVEWQKNLLFSTGFMGRDSSNWIRLISNLKCR